MTFNGLFRYSLSKQQRATPRKTTATTADRATLKLCV